MKSYILKSVIAVLAIALTTVSCKKEETTPPTQPTDPYGDLHKIAEMPATGSGLTVTLYMGEEPFMGYNYVFAVLKDDATGNVVENAQVTFMPMMDMGAMMHASPAEQPDWSVDDKAHKGTITFIMPSANGTWTVKVMVENGATMATGEAIFPITVINKAEPKLFSFVSAVDNAKIFVALVEPMNPKVGLNDFNVVIYKKQSMMDFPSVSDLQVMIDPEMPTMGHGSPNNVNPMPVGYGHYEGTVNFTMTGYWKVNMEFKDNMGNMMFDQGFFDITFQ